MVVASCVLGLFVLLLMGLFSFLVCQSPLWVLLMYVTWGMFFALVPILKSVRLNRQTVKRLVKWILGVQVLLWTLLLVFSGLHSDTVVWIATILIVGTVISAGVSFGMLGELAKDLLIEEKKGE